MCVFPVESRETAPAGVSRHQMVRQELGRLDTVDTGGTWPGNTLSCQTAELLLCDHHRPVSIPHLSCSGERETDPGPGSDTWDLGSCHNSYGWELDPEYRELPIWARPSSECKC